MNNNTESGVVLCASAQKAGVKWVFPALNVRKRTDEAWSRS